MGWMDTRDGADAHRLEAEIANDPQWVVFDDIRDEDPWATLELEEFFRAAAWWAGLHP